MKRKNDTPIANVILTMCIVHYFKIFSLYIVLKIFIGFEDIILRVNKIYIGVFIILFSIVYYFVFFNKDNWERYASVLKNEDAQKQKKGKVLVLFYLFGSIILFFVLLPFAFRK